MASSAIYTNNELLMEVRRGLILNWDNRKEKFDSDYLLQSWIFDSRWAYTVGCRYFSFERENTSCPCCACCVLLLLVFYRHVMSPNAPLHRKFAINRITGSTSLPASRLHAGERICVHSLK